MLVNFEVPDSQYDEMVGVAHSYGFSGLKNWFESVFQNLYNQNRLKRLGLEAERSAKKFLSSAVMEAGDTKIEIPPNVVPIIKKTGDPEFDNKPKNEELIDKWFEQQKEEGDDEVSRT